MNSKELIKYPYEYFAAQIYFARKISGITGENICAVAKEYTNLYGALTSDTYANDTDRNWVNIILSKFEYILLYISDNEEASQKIYKLFLNQENVSKTIVTYPKPTKKGVFGCFRYNYKDWYKDQNLIRLHFLPTRRGLFENDPKLQVGDLSRVFIEDRKKEFSDLINFIYNNQSEFSDAKYFMSSTWLQEVPAYQSFFPEKYSTDPYYRTQIVYSFHWIWSQFIKWDLSGNVSKFEEFRQKLSEANTLQQTIDSIPSKVYEVKVPLEEMFEMYVEDAYVFNEEYDFDSLALA